jgi:hypothetical protein
MGTFGFPASGFQIILSSSKLLLSDINGYTPHSATPLESPEITCSFGTFENQKPVRMKTFDTLAMGR